MCLLMLLRCCLQISASVNKSNADHCILFEAVNVIIHHVGAIAAAAAAVVLYFRAVRALKLDVTLLENLHVPGLPLRPPSALGLRYRSSGATPPPPWRCGSDMCGRIKPNQTSSLLLLCTDMRVTVRFDSFCFYMHRGILLKLRCDEIVRNPPVVIAQH